LKSLNEISELNFLLLKQNIERRREEQVLMLLVLLKLLLKRTGIRIEGRRD